MAYEKNVPDGHTALSFLRALRIALIKADTCDDGKDALLRFAKLLPSPTANETARATLVLHINPSTTPARDFTNDALEVFMELRNAVSADTWHAFQGKKETARLRTLKVSAVGSTSFLLPALRQHGLCMPLHAMSTPQRSDTTMPGHMQRSRTPPRAPALFQTEAECQPTMGSAQVKLQRREKASANGKCTLVTNTSIDHVGSMLTVAPIKATMFKRSYDLTFDTPFVNLAPQMGPESVAVALRVQPKSDFTASRDSLQALPRAAYPSGTNGAYRRHTEQRIEADFCAAVVELTGTPCSLIRAGEQGIQRVPASKRTQERRFSFVAGSAQRQEPAHQAATVQTGQ